MTGASIRFEAIDLHRLSVSQNGQILLANLLPCNTGPVPAEDAPDSWTCHDGRGTTHFRHLRVDQQYPVVS